MKILMVYNIAVASTDGINIDKHFGASDSFLIIKVNDDGTYENLGERVVAEEQNTTTSTSCGGGSSCGHSCGGHSDPAIQKKVEVISDCRCLLCSKCGPGSEKQLGKNNIATFYIDLKLDEALKTIIKYYKKSDEHQSLRDIRK
jgi:nitrogen fixation protein NifX